MSSISGVRIGGGGDLSYSLTPSLGSEELEDQQRSKKREGKGGREGDRKTASKNLKGAAEAEGRDEGREGSEASRR